MDSVRNNNKSHNSIIGHFAMFMATLFFGLNIPALKVLIPEWLNFTDAALMRIFGATVLFWISSIFIKNDKIDRKDWWLLILGGMIGLFFFLYLFSLSIYLTSPIDLSIIMTLPPIMVVIISALVYKTKLTKLKIFGVLLSLAGALLIILLEHHGEGAQRSMKGNIFGILSAFCYAIYLIIIKKPSEKYKPITLMRWLFLFSALTAIPFSFHLPHAKVFHDIQLEPVCMLLFIMIFPSYISYLLIPGSIRRIGQELVIFFIITQVVVFTPCTFK